MNFAIRFVMKRFRTAVVLVLYGTRNDRKPNFILEEGGGALKYRVLRSVSSIWNSVDLLLPGNLSYYDAH